MKNGSVFYIEQNRLPFDFIIAESGTYKDSCDAIRGMKIRGAGAIGAMAGFAMAQACLEAPAATYQEFITEARNAIESTRPTARNLFYATRRVFDAGLVSREAAIREAQEIADRDAADSKQIGIYGNELIPDDGYILTHCNAGWLAFVDHGTALSPVYTAFGEGKNIFVFVDETRPRNQGARLTAWELNNEGIPHMIIADNAGASLMAEGMIDLVITGADRIAVNGDTANKIGTLEKAIVAHEFNIPFYIAAPTSTFDPECASGAEIVIEHRHEDEMLYQEGPDNDGIIRRILVCSPGSPALNPAFDITPAKYITGFITEKGIIRAEEEEIRRRIMKNEK
jgi:S-methyl-5-thioribose-1-phosphate isomerase